MSRLPCKETSELFFEYSVDLLVVIGFDNLFKQVSPSFEEMLGWKKEEVLGKSFIDFIHPDDRDRSSKEAKAHESGKNAVRFENRYRCKDGSYRWISWNSHPLVKEQIVVGIGRDNTERKKTEEAIRASEEKYRHLLLYAPTAIYELDYNGPRFKSVNDGMCRLTGYSREELLSMNPLDLLDSESKERFRDRIRKVLAGEKIDESVEFRTITKDGRELWVVLYVKLMFKNGKIDGALVVGYDITERKKAEKALIESEERFSKTFQHSPTAMVISLPNGVIVDFNDAFTKLLGYTREDAIGKQGNAMGLYAVQSQRQQVIRELGEKGFICSMEMTFKHKSGKPVNVIFALVRITLNGQPHLLGTGIDITERKKTEEVLRVSQERFSKAFNASPAAVAISRLSDGLLTDVNETYLQLFGFTREEVIGHTSTELGIFTSSKEREKLVSLLKENGSIHNQETAFKTKQGKIIQTLVSLDSFTVDKEQFLISTILDITERKNAEEALKQRTKELERAQVKLEEKAAEVEKYASKMEELVKERTRELAYSNRKLAETLDSMQESFYVIDRNWNFVYANKLITAAVGMKPKDWIGNNLWSMFPQYLGTEIEENFRATMKDRKVRRFENQSRYSNIWYLVTVFPSVDGIGVLGYNITDHKNLEKAMKDQERLAAIGATAGMVGHDIRNPLQAITGDIYLLKDYLQSMPENPMKRDVEESLDAIDANIGYINKIVADLQDYARTLRPEYSQINLFELVTAVFQPIHLPSNIMPTIDIDPTLHFESDKTLLRRMLTNLIINAIQAMEERGGKLSVSSHLHGHSVVISVEDTGVGIPEEVKPKLFTPMVTTKSKGQGLGLAVVKRLVEALNGSISFDSEEGKGTKFIIRLPDRLPD